MYDESCHCHLVLCTPVYPHHNHHYHHRHFHFLVSFLSFYLFFVYNSCDRLSWFNKILKFTLYSSILLFFLCKYEAHYKRLLTLFTLFAQVGIRAPALVYTTFSGNAFSSVHTLLDTLAFYDKSTCSSFEIITCTSFSMVSLHKVLYEKLGAHLLSNSYYRLIIWSKSNAQTCLLRCRFLIFAEFNKSVAPPNNAV